MSDILDGLKKKKPSGAQNAKRKREREDNERLLATVKGEGDPSGMEAFSALGDAPLDDPNTAMEWVRKNQLVALQLILRDASLSAREKFRAVKEMSEAIGKTQNRAALEGDVKSLKEAIAGARSKTGAVKLEASGGVTRPATARRQGSRRGPRALSGSSSSTQEGQD